jgi:hypothetical protein
MPTYKQSAVTAKAGLNFVRTVVEAAGSLFHKVEQDSDLGIDGLLEFVRDKESTGKLVGVQVKSGNSYYSQKHRQCALPVDGHRDYWAKYSVPVIGVVYIPALQKAYWIDVQPYLERDPEANTIRFRASAANEFNTDRFLSIFMPEALHETPVLSIEQGLAFLQSGSPDERTLGVASLFRNHPNDTRVWDAFVNLLVSMPAAAVPPLVIYYLAHIPWHSDIAYFGEPITTATREHVRELLGSFRTPEVIKLLEFVDEENTIRRGSIGQSVDAIIRSLPNATTMLSAIAEDESLPLFRRECAALIYAIHDAGDALPILAKLKDSGSSYAQELMHHIREWGGINPY